mgnify:CR=1 FL=1
MSGKLDCHGMTDVGRRRETNEDQFLIADLNKSLRVHQTSLALDHQTRLFGNSQGNLLLVADGMGGHDAGERASTLAVDGVVAYTLNTLRWFFRLDGQSDDDFEEDLRAAMEHCQQLLNQESKALPQRRGMGTTLTLAYVIWPRMYVVHVGDSRCYVFRGGQLTQLTRDHTMAELYRESLETSPDAEGDSERRMTHILWNVVGGTRDDLSPEVHRFALELDDTVLLCSDGLTRHVSDDAIAAQLRANGSAEQLCRQLVDEANRQGGEDNITAVVARFLETDNNLFERAASVEEPLHEPPADPTSDTVPDPVRVNTNAQ